jgi:hypothetical protein
MSNFIKWGRHKRKHYDTTTLHPSIVPYFLQHVTPAPRGALNSWASGPISFTNLLGISCHIGAIGIGFHLITLLTPDC